MRKRFMVGPALAALAAAGCSANNSTSNNSTTASCTATVAGKAFSSGAYTTLNSSVLRIVCYNGSTRNGITLAIRVPPATGTYTLGGPAPYGQYSTFDFGSGTGGGITYATTTGQGTLTITAYNASTQVASGTFSFTGVLVSLVTGAPASIAVVQGSFSNAGPLP